LNIAESTFDQLEKDINNIDGELDSAVLKLTKLNEVTAPAVAWIETQTANADTYQWTPRILNVTTDLVKLKNDRYEITKLEFSVDTIAPSRKYSSVINIGDLRTGVEIPYEELQSDLEKKVADLSQQRETKLEAWDNAVKSVFAALDNPENWTVSQNSATTFTISGSELGLSDRSSMDLTMGVWTYHSDSGTISPSDMAAQTLQKVLMGKS
jgi:hypothetical protein